MHVDVAKCHACHAVSKLANYRGISSLRDWLWWRAWFPFGAVVAATVCVAGVALGGIDFTLRGRRGTWRHGPTLCVAGVALGDIDVHSAWQGCHLWRWAGSGGALGSRLAPWSPRLFAWQAWHLAAWAVTLHGRHGTWHRRACCVAGVPLWHWAGSGGALGSRLAVCVASVALGDINLHSAWQAWHLATSTVTLCGRRGTWRSTFTLRGRPGMLHYASMHLYVSLCISMYLYVSLRISTYLYVSLCISMCLYVSLCISMYLYVSLCISMYLYVSLCISMYLYVSLCHYVPLCISVYLCVSLCMSMYVYVCLCMSMYVYVCLCISVYLCVSLCISVYVYVCLCMSMFVYVCQCRSVYVYLCMYVCMYACMHVCMYVCMHVCMSVCMHLCVYVCMCVCMHACMHA